MNDLTIIDSAELEELNALLGTEVSGGKSEPSISKVPVLQINSRSKSKGTRKSIPEGSFYLRGLGEPAYSETATFRPLASHVQYLHFADVKQDNGEDKWTLISKSLAIINPNRDEARDTKGGIACGMPSWEARKDMDYSEAKVWRDMQNRVIRGLVSFTGKTEDGEEVVYENQPCIMFNKATNYGGFWKDFHSKLPAGSHLYNYQAEMYLQHNEKGSVSWYTIGWSPDLDNQLPLTQEVKETMMVFADTLRAENKEIDEKYFTAIKEGSIDSKAMSALGDSLDDDLEDVA